MSHAAAMTALIVEDDRNIRRSVCTSLESSGWTVHEAETLRQAVAHARSHLYDLVILDLGLPDGDGVDFLRDLRAWSQVPVIVLSARSEEAHKIAALGQRQYWMSDNRHLICVSGGKIFLLDSQTKSARQILEIPRREIRSASISTDGRRIYFSLVTDESDIRLLTLE